MRSVQKGWWDNLLLVSFIFLCLSRTSSPFLSVTLTLSISVPLFFLLFYSGGELLDQAGVLRLKATSFSRKKKSVQLQIATLQKLPQPWDGLGVLSPYLRCLIWQLIRPIILFFMSQHSTFFMQCGVFFMCCTGLWRTSPRKRRRHSWTHSPLWDMKNSLQGVKQSQWRRQEEGNN